MAKRGHKRGASEAEKGLKDPSIDSLAHTTIESGVGRGRPP